MISCEQLEELIGHNAFDKQMHFKVRCIENGYTELEFTSNPAVHGNLRGHMHGGALSSISDTAMGTACFTLGKTVSTVELSCNYLRPVLDHEHLVIKTRVVHNGKRTMVVTSEFYNDQEKLVVIGKGTFFVLGHIDVDTLTPIEG